MNQILMKFIYMIKIYNCLLMKKNSQVYSILIFQKLLSSTQTICTMFKKISKYNIWKTRKILIVFDEMIFDMFSNKKPNPIVLELFISWMKLNISLIFITQSYFAVSKNIRISSTHYFVLWKIFMKENFNKLYLMIFQSLVTLWVFVTGVLQNHILFWLQILLLYQIFLNVSERII